MREEPKSELYCAIHDARHYPCVPRDVREALATLAQFAGEAPGRLPERVERARQLAAAETATVDSALLEAADWLMGLRDRQGLDLVRAAHVKLLHEAAELKAACDAVSVAGKGEALEEAADVAICLAGVLAGRGLSLGDLSRAILRKVEVNRMRRWVRQQDGTWQHGD